LERQVRKGLPFIFGGMYAVACVRARR
jgi:hypothetical protein